MPHARTSPCRSQCSCSWAERRTTRWTGWGLSSWGTPLPGETLEETARREVREETGLFVHILERLGDISYSFSVRGVRHLKTVHFYLLNAVSGSIDEHDWENDYVAWVPEQDVPRLM